MSAKVIGIPNSTMGVRIFIVVELHCSAAPLLQHRSVHSRSLSSEPAPIVGCLLAPSFLRPHCSFCVCLGSLVACLSCGHFFLHLLIALQTHLSAFVQQSSSHLRLTLPFYFSTSVRDPWYHSRHTVLLHTFFYTFCGISTAMLGTTSVTSSPEMVR